MAGGARHTYGPHQATSPVGRASAPANPGGGDGRPAVNRPSAARRGYGSLCAEMTTKPSWPWPAVTGSSEVMSSRFRKRVWQVRRAGKRSASRRSPMPCLQVCTRFFKSRSIFSR